MSGSAAASSQLVLAGERKSPHGLAQSDIKASNRFLCRRNTVPVTPGVTKIKP